MSQSQVESAKKVSTDRPFGDLCDYETGDIIRPATADEAEASERAARHDGGAGVIEVDGRGCYVA